MEFISLCFLVFQVIVALIAVLIVYLNWKLKYWERRNIPFLPPKFPFGNMKNPFTSDEHLSFQIKRFYDKMRADNIKELGALFFIKPTLIISDLELIKLVLIKDFDYFPTRNLYYNEKIDPLSANLVNVEGARWKSLRTKVTPTFTSGKMKSMFGALIECEEALHKLLEEEFRKQEPIDIKEILARFTTDVIGSCAFGLDCNSIKNQNSQYRFYGKKIFATSFSGTVRRLSAQLFPRLFKILHIKSIAQDVEDFFINLVAETVDYREKHHVIRNDFLQLMMKLKNSENFADKLTLNEVAAQCFTFFSGGFETSSTSMTFTLYLLAKHQDVQDKLRQEIKKVLAKYGGKITYEALQDFSYMTQVIDESLRMYPPAAMTARLCTNDYKATLSDRTVTIKKGEQVIIPILGIHYDPQYYPSPEKFDPENFSEEAKAVRPNLSHLPFGEGPRNCIGLRFAYMEMKVGLAAALKDYRYTVNERTIEPLKMHPRGQVLTACGDIWLNIEKV